MNVFSTLMVPAQLGATAQKITDSTAFHNSLQMQAGNPLGFIDSIGLTFAY